MDDPETRWKIIGMFIVGGVIGLSAGFVLGLVFYSQIFPA